MAKLRTGRNIRLLVILGLALFAAAACKKSSPPPSRPLPVRVPPPAAAQPAAEQKAEEKGEQFRYDPLQYRDPFVTLIKERKKDEIPEEMLSPLQRVAVTDLKLEGIIIMGRQVVAQVITPDGKAHKVTVGTPMGRHGGKVRRITSDSVIVEEEFEDYTGQRSKQETVLRLREEEESS